MGVVAALVTVSSKHAVSALATVSSKHAVAALATVSSKRAVAVQAVFFLKMLYRKDELGQGNFFLNNLQFAKMIGSFRKNVNFMKFLQ